jgi:hypothetical protein
MSTTVALINNTQSNCSSPKNKESIKVLVYGWLGKIVVIDITKRGYKENILHPKMALLTRKLYQNSDLYHVFNQ